MKDRLKNTVMTVVMLAAVLVTRPANAALVAHYEFDDKEGTVVRDSSGNGYDGKVVEGAPVWDSGKYGGCLNFDGTYGVSIPSAVFSNMRKAITISVWTYCKVDQKKAEKAIFQAGVGGGDDYHRLVSICADWHAGGLTFCTGYDDEIGRA